MTAAMVKQHDAWTANGGELFMYYVVAWDYQWGFTDNINNLDTPKYRALDQIARSAPVPITYGTPVPANMNAGRWSITSGSTAQPGDGPITLKPLEFNGQFDPGSAYWTAYTVRADNPGAYQLSATYFGNQPGELKFVVDGIPLSTVGLQSTGGADQSTGPLTVTLGSGLHSIRLQAQRGQFNLRSLAVATAPPPLPVQAPPPPPVQDMPALPPVQDTPAPPPVQDAPPPPAQEMPVPVDDMPPAVEMPPADGGMSIEDDNLAPASDLIPVDDEAAS
jgi:hypothetical protein